MDRLKKGLWITAILVIVFFGLRPGLQAAEFSADMEITAGGQTVAQGKIFVKGDLTRQEMSHDGHKITVINRPDKGVTWTLMPRAKNYIESSFAADSEKQLPDNWSQKLKNEAKSLGSETVNGMKCDKYEISGDGEKVTYWIARGKDLPVRIRTAGSEINYRNIRTGKQPDRLFKLPAGYHKFAIPNIPGMQGMGNMQGMPPGTRR